MRTRHVWAVPLLVGLLWVADAAANWDCEVEPGDRVQLLFPMWGYPTLDVGTMGTVVCTKDWGWYNVLVSFDDWTDGLDEWNLMWCQSTIWPHRPNSLLWVSCCCIYKLPCEAPDFVDCGEIHRFFKPQVFVACKPNQCLEVCFTILNQGGSPYNPVNVKVYASKDTRITPSDYLLGTTPSFFLSGGGELKLTLKTVLPDNIPPGFYYVGWIIDPENKAPEEVNKANNRAYVGCYRLLVSGAAPCLELSAACGGEISDPKEGVFVYDQDTVLSVEATAAAGCTFAGWTGTAVRAGKVADPSAPWTEVAVNDKYSLKAVFDGPHMMIDDFESYAYVETQQCTIGWAKTWWSFYDHVSKGNISGVTWAYPGMSIETVKDYLAGCMPLQARWVDGLFFPVEYDANGDAVRFRKGNNTGATIGNAAESDAHCGTQAMEFCYDNLRRPYYSEACRSLGMADWAATGARDLSIWYRGSKNNTPVPMSIVVEDVHGHVAVITHEDYEAVCTSKWTQWKIPLCDIADEGVMLCRVVRICIRLGEKDNIWDVGKGTMYFDDIALVHK